jgi:exopolyphosphatase/pppGpp-phosphohydrolase
MSNNDDLSEQNIGNLQHIFQLAEYCKYDADHAWQVTKFALQLFDDLRELHHFGTTERYLLTCASILHDIGWIEGWQNHHKTTLIIILETKLLPFDSKTRLLIGSIARYHRGALPSKKHDHYATLDENEKKVVSILAACLRLADALDETHHQRIQAINCQIKKNKIVLQCQIKEPASEEEKACREKCDLLEKVFRRHLITHWNTNKTNAIS